jgi:hypothetical protein
MNLPTSSHLQSLVAASFVCLTHAAFGTITVHHHWQFGEGANAGADSIGSVNLITTGTTTNATGAPSSAIGQDFVNTASEAGATNYMTSSGTFNSALSAAGNNWGVEVWANLDLFNTSGAGTEVGIVHLGYDIAQTSQVVLEGNGAGPGKWALHRPGQTFDETGPITLDTWTHLVYLGTGQLFINGVDAGLPGGRTLNFPGGTMAVGAMEGSLHRGFDGQVDDLRLFSFAPGTFSINDTLAFTVIPEPASAGLLALSGLALLRRRRAEVTSADYC